MASSHQLHDECVTHAVNVITKRMGSELKPYTERKDIFAEQHNNGTEHLAGIVRSAMEFDQTLCQQKAYFVFNRLLWPSPGQRKKIVFSPTWMQGEYTRAQVDYLVQKKVCVQLLCSPALVKFGTSAGESYEKDMVISKAIVDCLASW